MKKVYLDNASTSAVRAEVIVAITNALQNEYGNPSSIHSFGRSAKGLIETARKTVAKAINATPQEIIFTSGGTEANNWILESAVRDLKVERIITSKIEHHAVLHTTENLEKQYKVQVDYVKLLPNGDIDINHLVELLSANIPTLVSLMHVNNETGNILDLERVGRIIKQHNAYFHSDTVQSIGKLPFDLQQLSIDFLVASAHKFHGPKGIGFAYIKKNIFVRPMIHGGEQEKGLRAGTESVHNIVGLATALETSYAHLLEEKEYILDLKNYLLDQLKINFPEFKINGNSSNSFYTIANILLPFSEEKTAMILFHLDMKGIAVSRGSACQSGSSKPSHVLKEILSEYDTKRPSLRISFSHYNTKEDIDLLIEALKTV
ncbi:cysteine desulfurase family protein [Flavobacterium sp. '19STA2R22 D10 B1']|uniref:cysteine desulfurase family protein n=1 Tax=Flavobacterium aerium TaxID=3037261 RepID=UPI00278BF2A9|nr:cysteine desulfurase family protein [Flavobacterium sp. '19STA2R22 D10 B1']